MFPISKLLLKIYKCYKMYFFLNGFEGTFVLCDEKKMLPDADRDSFLSALTRPTPQAGGSAR